MTLVWRAGLLALTLTVGGLTVSVTVIEAGQESPAVPTGQLDLGNVTIPRNVMADGQALPSGTYQLRLTAEASAPHAAGQTDAYERWVEFLRGDTVAGREVVSIVPASEIGDVAQVAPLGNGGTSVQLLRGNDYLRVWLNRDGVHYLIHLPTGLPSS